MPRCVLAIAIVPKFGSPFLMLGPIWGHRIVGRGIKRRICSSGWRRRADPCVLICLSVKEYGPTKGVYEIIPTKREIALQIHCSIALKVVSTCMSERSECM